MTTRSFHLNITMENAAFEESPCGELGRILTDLAVAVSAGDFACDRLKLRDGNGNTVGFAEYQTEQ
jgi:hypothetical protein